MAKGAAGPRRSLLCHQREAPFKEILMLKEEKPGSDKEQLIDHGSVDMTSDPVIASLPMAFYVAPDGTSLSSHKEKGYMKR